MGYSRREPGAKRPLFSSPLLWNVFAKSPLIKTGKWSLIERCRKKANVLTWSVRL